jgi:single-stranded-DNA-specific exonuclease
MENGVVRRILKKRGVADAQAFLNPNYDATKYDPFLLTDMDKAVSRIATAVAEKQKTVIFGDYDVDGISATAILADALPKFGLEVSTYTPDRFTEGYGLNMEAVERIAKSGAKLVITVDCGSLNIDEVAEANKLGLDVIITDHHAIGDKLPEAVAVINPHRKYCKYLCADLCGAGVAFKLVQALQTRLDGLPEGQEKWLLDLVALGTVCDIVPLLDENRNNVHWGLEVMKKTRRAGLRALLAVSRTKPSELSARQIGFVLGPRLNAAGRLETAKQALELLTTTNNVRALELAQRLDKLNLERRNEQDRIFAEVCEILEHKNAVCKDGPCKVGKGVIVVDGEGWNEGVIGIVASKVMEKYRQPAFVVSRNGAEAKGSGRSFGDFHLAEAIEATRQHLTKGGGHAAAGGVSLASENIDQWREALQEFYTSRELKNQEKFLLANEDVETAEIGELSIELVNQLAKLEPFGMGNERPVFKLPQMSARYVDRIGKDSNHLKLTITDGASQIKLLAFSPPSEWFVELGETVDVWANLEINEWNGTQTVEGRVVRLERN